MRETDRKNRAILLAGLLFNVLLSGVKLVFGGLEGLVSVIADGLNNLGDGFSLVIGYISLKIAEKPADRDHPFGHRRAESIAVLLTGVLILLMAAGLFRESIGKIISARGDEASLIVKAILICSIVFKLFLGFFYRGFKKKRSSEALFAASIDSFCDCFSSIAVLLGVSIRGLDGWAGIVVAIFVAAQGGKLLFEASSKLLGKAPDQAVERAVREEIRKTEKILGFHDLRIYSYGDACFATVHVEMDASFSSLSSHAILDELEKRVLRETKVLLSTHLDPVDLCDEEAIELEKEISSLAEHLCEGLKLHDFKLIRGTVNKIVFEASVPFSCKEKDEKILEKLSSIASSVSGYVPFIQIERE